ncbi:hypothetical protein B0J17DRAFT_163229 [Rhizoctonia solani]|nr:hypothetical protein B0J17DRAFT_163229 [Rhizoctonia solani]
MPGATTTSTMQSTSSPRNKKMAGPPPTTSGIAQAQNKRPSLRYSLNHLGKALADAVGKDSKSSAHVRSASAIPASLADRSGSSSPSTRPSTQLGLRRPSVAGAFERPSLDAVKAPQAAVLSSPKRASPPKTSTPPTSGPTAGVIPITRRRSFMVKGALAAPSGTAPTNPSGAAPVPVGTAKLAIRPKMSAPPRVTTDDERPVEVKERRTESPRRPPVTAINRTRERVDSRASPVRLGPGFAAPTTKGRASPGTPRTGKESRRGKERGHRAGKEGGSGAGAGQGRRGQKGRRTACVIGTSYIWLYRYFDIDLEYLYFH